MYLNLETTKALLRRAVEEYGEDWVDPNAARTTCTNVYRHEGQVRRCIVGQVLHYAGVDDEALLRFDGNADSTIAMLIYRDGSPYQETLDVSEDAEELLIKVQQRQDECHPWGEAITV